MLQLIFHGIGDFFLQTDYQALNKKKKGRLGLKQCLIHCTTYSLPFLFIASWKAVLAIFITHFIIDRTNIVAYALAIKNNVLKPFKIGNKIVYHVGGFHYDISNFGFGKEKPFAMSIWLYIITDNLCHIICNYLSIMYL